MKTGIVSFILIFTALFTFGQPGILQQRCNVPMPDHLFRQRLKTVSMQPTDELKLNAAMTALSGNCYSVEQIRTFAGYFAGDQYRLDFAKAAWHNTVDREHFYYVFDAFANFSTVFMLYDYVKSVEGHPHDYLPPFEPPLSMNFPAFEYPAYTNYQGPSNCNYPIREDEFLRLAFKLNSNQQEFSRLAQLQQVAKSNCLSVAQVMKFASLLESENNRLEFFRTAIGTIFDIGNLNYGSQLFAHIPNRAAFEQLIQIPDTGTVPGDTPPCYVPDNEFDQILSTIRKESFNSAKVTLAKQILRSKQCFTTIQVREMLRLFSFDDSRLEMAKFAYDFTTDPENYYMVADVFTFSSSREELMKYLAGK